MFIGHFAVGFAAKKISSNPSLGTYFLAAQFLDLLWPTFLLFKIETVRINSSTAGLPLTFTSYPISHSLALVLVWAALFAIIYYAIRKDIKAAIVLGACVVSHWLLDLIVHIPDLPLYPGDSPVFGLGLWKSVKGSLIVEMLLFIAGIILYVNATKASNKAGSVGFWALTIFLFVVHLANIFSTPPPSVNAVAWAGQLQWLLVLWAFWVDRNRYNFDSSIPVTPKIVRAS